MRGSIDDLQYAARRLWLAPGLTIAAALTLALGLGATTAIFSIVDAVMLRPLPHHDPNRLVDIAISNGSTVTSRHLTASDWAYWRAQTDVFDAVEAHAIRRAVVTEPGTPETLVGTQISGGLMSMLGTRAQFGRTLAPADAAPGRQQVIAISNALWRARFGADPEVVGRSIRLDDTSYEVIGVMPAAFDFPYGRRQFWVPLPSRADTPARVSLTARIRPELDVAAAQIRVDARAPALAASGAVPTGWRVALVPPLARDVDRPVRRALYALGGAGLLVLLIGCANVANLLLLQGAGRRRELAMRAALGASRARLLRQLLAETALLGLAAGVLGLLIAQWAIALVVALAPASVTLLTAIPITLDTRVVAFGAALTVITTVVSGLAPALRLSGGVPQEALRPRATRSPAQERLRAVFVLAQVALALMLLVGAGLLLRTFAHVTRIDPGFEARNVVAVDLALPPWKYPSPAAQRQFFEDLLARVRRAGGVGAATITGGAPPTGGGVSFDLRFEIEGRGVVLDDPGLMMAFSEVDGDYFDVMGIPLEAGRTFSASDTPGSPGVIVIGEAMARRLWRGENPVGARLRWRAGGAWHTVIGVVGDVYQLRHDQPRDQLGVYFAASQSRGMPAQQTLIVRTSGTPAAVIPAIRQLIWDVDRDQPIKRIESLDAAYAEFFAPPRFYAVLVSIFAGIGLTIAVVGLYAVVAFATAQRTREFGVRLALGARPRDVLRLAVRDGLTVTGLGIAAGAAASVVIGRWIASLLVEVPATDAPTYGSVILLLGAVAFAACWIPARRVARIDPASALRYE